MDKKLKKEPALKAQFQEQSKLNKKTNLLTLVLSLIGITLAIISLILNN